MSDHNECPTCLQDWVANTDYECGCCGRPASEHIRVTSLCRILRETQQRENSLIVQLSDAKTSVEHWQAKAKQADEAANDLVAELIDTRREWKEEIAAERALADRLAEALKELLYYDLQDVNLGRLKSSRDALTAWKEARSE